MDAGAPGEQQTAADLGSIEMGEAEEASPQAPRETHLSPQDDGPR
jgi:hypothetical protein